jgi:hypothetical protein
MTDLLHSLAARPEQSIISPCIMDGYCGDVRPQLLPLKGRKRRRLGVGRTPQTLLRCKPLGQESGSAWPGVARS